MAKNVKKLEYMFTKKNMYCNVDVHKLFIGDIDVFIVSQNKTGISAKSIDDKDWFDVDNYDSAKDVVLDYAEILIEQYGLQEYNLLKGTRRLASREMNVGNEKYNVILGRNLEDQLRIRRIQRGDSTAESELHGALTMRYMFKPKRPLLP